MGNEQSHFLLKFYSGPHAGAEIQLQPGRYTLGRASNCDIILNDSAVAEHHLELNLNESGSAVQSLAVPVYCEGREVNVADWVMDWHQIVTLGTTHFCCGPADQAWPAIHLPNLQTAQPTTAHERDFSSPDLAQPSPTDTTSHATAWSFAHPPMKRLLARRPYSFGGVSLLFICGLLVFSMGNTHPVRLLVEPPKPVEQIQRLVEDLGLQQIQVTETKGQTLLKVQGYVENAAQKAALQEALSTVDNPLQQHVWIAAELASSADAVLEAMGISDLQITGSTVGELIMQGYVGDDARWRTALNTLQQDIPGVSAINDSAVETPTIRAKQLRQWLQEYALDKVLSISVEADRLVVNGTLGSQELVAWAKVQRQFRSQYGRHPELQSRIRETREAIELDIKSVSVGPTAFFITQDGRQYMEGARLTDGYFVKSITHDRIVLTRNNQDYAYYLGSK